MRPGAGPTAQTAMSRASRTSSVRRWSAIAPADDAATEGVERRPRGRGSPPTSGLGDVGDPQPVRAGGAEVALDEVGAGRGAAVADRRAAKPAPVDARVGRAARISRATRLRDDTDARRPAGRRGCGARRRCRGSGVGPPIWSSSASARARARTRAPGVVAAPGDAQHAAQGADTGMAFSARRTGTAHRVPSVSLAKKAAAFFRISRSSRAPSLAAAARRAPRSSRERARRAPVPSRITERLVLIPAQRLADD